MNAAAGNVSRPLDPKRLSDRRGDRLFECGAEGGSHSSEEYEGTTPAASQPPLLEKEGKNLSPERT
jgi:hypothetical protein